jgi:hypothetical protein
MMARNTNVPFKGRIQKRKTHDLQIITFDLQRAAGPYRRANTGSDLLSVIKVAEKKGREAIASSPICG